MTTISTLRDLEALMEKLQAAALAYSSKYYGRVVFGLHFHTGSSEKRNAINDQYGLPRVIAVTPAIASFLARDQQAFDIKERAIPFPLKELLVAPILLLLGVLEPVRALKTLTTTGSLVLKLRDALNEYARICAERDQIAGKVMDAYYLAQDGAEHYVLRRAEWRREYSGQGPVTERKDRVGVDPSMDLSKLPCLPSPACDGSNGGNELPL